MAPQNGSTPQLTAGVKRALESGGSSATGPISLKKVPAYDPTKEQAPNSVTLSKEWAAFDEGKTHLHKLLTNVFKLSSYHDEVTESLLKLVDECFLNHDPEKIVVGLSGLMNTGKSRTLNSLFQVGAIARQGASGGSCTLASCMYRGMRPGQTTPFLAEVVFFTRKERRDILKDYLVHYYRATHDLENDDGSPSTTADDPAEESSNIDIRKEVTDVLVSLFGKHSECASKAAARRFLDTATCEDDRSILDRLYEWTDTLIRRAAGDIAVVSVTASTPEDLNTKLQAFTAYGEDEFGELSVSYTPLVSLITFYFDDPLTRLGIAFLDSPGTSDVNRTRRLSAHKYRHLRTHTMLFTDVGRSKDDTSISKEVYQMRNHGAGRVVIVVTRIDAIDENIPNGSKRDKDTVERLRRAVERYEKEFNVVEIQLNDAHEAENVKLAFSLSSQQKELEVRVRLAINAERRHRIEMRNEYIKKEIRDKINDIATAPIPVRFVSNPEYAKHVLGYPPKYTPVLDVEGNGIPPLRRESFTFPNEARKNEVKYQQDVC